MHKTTLNQSKLQVILDRIRNTSPKEEDSIVVYSKREVKAARSVLLNLLAKADYAEVSTVREVRTEVDEL